MAETQKYRKVTLDMVLAATSLTKSSKETSDAYLGRVTHLHLQGKRIKVIEGLELCSNLKVLYLYDNMIEHIQGLNNQTILYYVYLQNNQIKELPTMHMPALKKLYLDDNDLQVVSGLSECHMLEELHLARQRLPSFTSLQFEPESLFAMSQSLQVLEISGCGISILSNFRILRNLRKIFAKENLINDLNEVEAMMGLPRIEEASFADNPCCKMYKYRDIVIAAAPDCLKLFDECEVLRHQQVAIRGLVTMRRKEGYLTNFVPPEERFSES
jgi:protein phosphatase 1 regulatory subunit 42